MEPLSSGSETAVSRFEPAIYHFSDTARLPWILRSRQLLPGRNKIGGFPDPDFIWATSDPRGDLTASADRGEHYRMGKVHHVRFTLARSDFLTWREAQQAFPQWTPEFVRRLELAALGKSSPDQWWCRADALSLDACRLIETRSYRDNRWKRLSDGTPVMPAEDGWLAMPLGERLFASRRVPHWSGADAFEVRASA